MIFSNIGGAATAIGDPPNVLIASDLDFINEGITFLNFSLHMSLCVIIVGIICALYLRFALRNINEKKEDKELHDLRHEIIIWNKTLRSLSNFSREEAIGRYIHEIVSPGEGQVTHSSGPKKLKNSRPKKLVKSNKSI